MKRYKSHLSRSRVDSLPVNRKKDGSTQIVYHRPQEHSATVQAFGGTVRERGNRPVNIPLLKTEVLVETDVDGVFEYVTKTVYKREWDNPDKPDVSHDANGKLQWNIGKSYSNFIQAMRYVAVLNNQDNRQRAYLPQIRSAYLLSLRDANICYLCKNPINTKTAQIAYGDRPDVTRDTIIADVISHYRVYRNKETGKYYFSFFDGSGFDVRSKLVESNLTDSNGRKARVTKFFVDGSEYHPASQYRVEYAKCDCKLAS